MKRIAIAVVCLFLLSTFTFAADKPKADAKAAANSAHQDKKFLLNYLQQTRKDFLKSISVGGRYTDHKHSLDYIAYAWHGNP